MDEIEVTFVNWGHYQQGRKDVQRPSWFRVDNISWRSQSLHGMTARERWVWFCLLSCAAEKNAGTFILNAEWFAKMAEVTIKDLESSLLKLARYGDVTWTSRARAVIDGQDITDKTDKTDGSGGVAERPAPVSNATAWISYCDAYKTRYGVEPKQNATTNSQMSAFVKRVGIDEAPEVLKFYLSHNGSYYLQNHHPIGAALKDAESLRTQWKRGRAVTANDVRNFEKTDHLRSQIDRIQKGEL